MSKGNVQSFTVMHMKEVCHVQRVCSAFGCHNKSRWQSVRRRSAGRLTRQVLGRYRKFKMSDEVDLVVRCELDGVMNYKGQDQLLSIKALNEFDPKLTGARTLPSAYLTLWDTLFAILGVSHTSPVEWEAEAP